jgi:hypothetical protein
MFEIIGFILRPTLAVMHNIFFYLVGALVLKLITLGKYPDLTDFFSDLKEDPFIIISDSAVISGFGILIVCFCFGFFIYYTNP